MNQNLIFKEGEGDAWFLRNREGLGPSSVKWDWVTELILFSGIKSVTGSVLDIGCANGWRLHCLRRVLGSDKRYVGCDISESAILDGRRFEGVELHLSDIAAIELEGLFDLVLVNFVLCWVDRHLLSQAVDEIDQRLNQGGHLLIGDFMPDKPTKSKYHHLPGSVHTYKDDYSKLFIKLGYTEIARINFDHDKGDNILGSESAYSRGGCWLLKK